MTVKQQIQDSRNKFSIYKNIQIPCYILQDRTLAVLESITEYLKEQKNLSYHDIAVLLNRDDRTIWTVYNRAKKKRTATGKVTISKQPKINLPTKIFQDRTLAVLESATEYLKDNKKMTYHQIAAALQRDDRTIWTTYNRVKKKRRQNGRAK